MKKGVEEIVVHFQAGALVPESAQNVLRLSIFTEPSPSNSWGDMARHTRPRLAGSGSSAPSAVVGVWISSFAEGDDVVGVHPEKRDAALVRGGDHDVLVAAGRLAGDEPGSTLLQPGRHRPARIHDPLAPRRIGAHTSAVCALKRVCNGGWR
jgi:hypothetical protein